MQSNGHPKNERSVDVPTGPAAVDADAFTLACHDALRCESSTLGARQQFEKLGGPSSNSPELRRIERVLLGLAVARDTFPASPPSGAVVGLDACPRATPLERLGRFEILRELGTSAPPGEAVPVFRASDVTPLPTVDQLPALVAPVS